MTADQTDYKRYYLAPGFVYVPLEPTIITTVLGSCVSVCLYDNNKRYGGMNHYLQPWAIDRKNATTKYGDTALYMLYKTFREFGSKKDDLIAGIIGGGYIERSRDSKLVADENVKAAEEFLKSLNIEIVFKDTGGTLGRKVAYKTGTNDAEIIKLKRIDADYIRAIDKIGIL